MSPAWPAPTISIRSPDRGREDGVVDLALGLGRTIVDGDLAWTYSPASPARTPPFADVDEMLHGHADGRSGP